MYYLIYGYLNFNEPVTEDDVLDSISRKFKLSKKKEVDAAVLNVARQAIRRCLDLKLCFGDNVKVLQFESLHDLDSYQDTIKRRDYTIYRIIKGHEVGIECSDYGLEEKEIRFDEKKIEMLADLHEDATSSHVVDQEEDGEL